MLNERLYNRLESSIANAEHNDYNINGKYVKHASIKFIRQDLYKIDSIVDIISYYIDKFDIDLQNYNKVLLTLSLSFFRKVVVDEYNVETAITFNRILIDNDRKKIIVPVIFDINCGIITKEHMDKIISNLYHLFFTNDVDTNSVYSNYKVVFLLKVDSININKIEATVSLNHDEHLKHIAEQVKEKLEIDDITPLIDEKTIEFVVYKGYRLDSTDDFLDINYFLFNKVLYDDNKATVKLISMRDIDSETSYVIGRCYVNGRECFANERIKKLLRIFYRNDSMFWCRFFTYGEPGVNLFKSYFDNYYDHINNHIGIVLEQAHSVDIDISNEKLYERFLHKLLQSSSEFNRPFIKGVRYYPRIINGEFRYKVEWKFDYTLSLKIDPSLAMIIILFSLFNVSEKYNLVKIVTNRYGNDEQLSEAARILMKLSSIKDGLLKINKKVSTIKVKPKIATLISRDIHSIDSLLSDISSDKSIFNINDIYITKDKTETGNEIFCAAASIEGADINLLLILPDYCFLTDVDIDFFINKTPEDITTTIKYVYNVAKIISHHEHFQHYISDDMIWSVKNILRKRFIKISELGDKTLVAIRPSIIKKNICGLGAARSHCFMKLYTMDLYTALKTYNMKISIPHTFIVNSVGKILYDEPILKNCDEDIIKIVDDIVLRTLKKRHIIDEYPLSKKIYKITDIEIINGNESQPSILRVTYVDGGETKQETIEIYDSYKAAALKNIIKKYKFPYLYKYDILSETCKFHVLSNYGVWVRLESEFDNIYVYKDRRYRNRYDFSRSKITSFLDVIRDLQYDTNICKINDVCINLNVLEYLCYFDFKTSKDAFYAIPLLFS